MDKRTNRFIRIMNKAKEHSYAVGAVNIFNYISACAAMDAAEEIGRDIIIQTSTGTVREFGAGRLFAMINLLREGRNIDVALHLDHCTDKELGKECVLAGWDAIMMDFSAKPLAENIRDTKEMRMFAHEHNVAIEGEVGVICGVEEDIVSAVAVGAGYEETIKFIKESGVDAIAPAIGTAHGVYTGEPVLNFDLVEQLGKEKTPIVIHGGSGLSAKTFRRLIQLGGRKINISTLVKQAYLDTVHELALSGEKLSPISFDNRVYTAVKEEIKKHLLVFGQLKEEF